MSIQKDMKKAVHFNYPEYIPVRVNLLPAVWMKYRDQLHELTNEYPELFNEDIQTKEDYDTVNGKFIEGDTTDAWGCVWSNAVQGLSAIVTEHPVPNRADVHTLKIPDENEGFPHGFMYLRLEDLRGFEESMVDFAEEPPELQLLIDKVLQYNLRQAEIGLSAISEPNQIVYFGDDLGMQQSLPISPEKWRTYLKPCYQKIFASYIKQGHDVYFHSDGCIVDIIPDLIECGISVINPQVGANGIDNLVNLCKGKICVDLDLDRQKFPFFSTNQIDEHVHEAVEKLGSPEGGLWIIGHVDQSVPLDNINALCRAFMKYRGYYRRKI